MKLVLEGSEDFKKARMMAFVLREEWNHLSSELKQTEDPKLAEAVNMLEEMANLAEALVPEERCEMLDSGCNGCQFGDGCDLCGAEAGYVTKGCQVCEACKVCNMDLKESETSCTQH